MMFTADPPPALAVAADEPVSNLMGVVATGPQGDLDRLEAATKSAGFPCRQMDGPKGHQLMVVFAPGSDPARITDYLATARGADYATLKIGTLAAPAR
jgi:hypothetical protein